MLGLGAVLGPYQAVKDDVSVCCVRCFAGRRVCMNRAMQHGTLVTVRDAIIDNWAGLRCNVSVLCAALAGVDGPAGASTKTRQRRQVGHRVASKHRAQRHRFSKKSYILTLYSKYTRTLTVENFCQSVEEELHCHHRAVAPFLVRTACVCRDAMVQLAPLGGSGAEACHVYLLADSSVFRQVLE
jgi:hypothetical protein